jgi:hypothetical protein
MGPAWYHLSSRGRSWWETSIFSEETQNANAELENQLPEGEGRRRDESGDGPSRGNAGFEFRALCFPFSDRLRGKLTGWGRW